MANQVQSFLRNQCFLIWHNNRGLIATPRVPSENPPNDIFESIKAIAMAIQANVPLNLDAQEEGALLKLTYPLAGSYLSPSVQKINTYIRQKWRNSYLGTHADQGNVVLWFVAFMGQRNSYLYKDQAYFYRSMDGFLSFYQNVPATLKPLIKDLCKAYPQVFSACGDPESHGYFLARLLEKNDPLTEPCLRKILSGKNSKENLLKNWLNVPRRLYCIPFNSSLKELRDLASNEIPPEWIHRTLQQLLFFTDATLPNNSVNLLALNPSFFDFYYYLRVGHPYDHERLKQTFPLPKEFNQEKQTQYRALLHQSVCMAAECLRDNNWNLDQILAYFMLRRNFIAHYLGEKDPEETAIPGPVEGKSLKTPCHGPLWADLRALLSNPQNWNGFVHQEGDAYHLQAALGNQQFTHSTIVLSGEDVIVEHGKNPQIRKEILKGVGILFERAKNEQGLPFMKSLGLIFWWIIRSKQWLSGEVGIAEGVVRSLALTKGVLPPWKPGVAPADEVMKHFDPNEFAEKFPSFFL